MGGRWCVCVLKGGEGRCSRAECGASFFFPARDAIAASAPRRPDLNAFRPPTPLVPNNAPTDLSRRTPFPFHFHFIGADIRRCTR